jgi:hypothetical protein
MSRTTQKRPRKDVQESLTYSKEFPEGYGDFVFKSQDGVTFHFPRFFLSHVSPVFKDMYQAGEGAQNQDIVVLTEDHKTIEQFLCHIDPAKDTPSLDWDRVAGVLQAAEKYQVNSIIKWFEKEVSMSLTATYYPTLPNPMLYFALARRYDLHMTARLALRQLIKCPLSEIFGSVHVDSSLLKHIVTLRVARAQWLADVIHECPDFPYSNKAKCYTHNSPYGGTGHHLWKRSAMKAVMAEPSWSAIVSSLGGTGGKCPCGCVILESAVEQKKKVEEMEAKLPELES